MADSQQTEIPATDARDQISEVIARVAFGRERIVITLNGKPQVAVVPLNDLGRLKELDQQQATAAVARMRKKATASKLDRLSDEDVEGEITAARKSRRRSK